MLTLLSESHWNDKMAHYNHFSTHLKSILGKWELNDVLVEQADLTINTGGHGGSMFHFMALIIAFIQAVMY